MERGGRFMHSEGPGCLQPPFVLRLSKPVLSVVEGYERNGSPAPRLAKSKGTALDP